ncbi:hypothetical protein CcaverHIS002_0109140 [Cutaneotrichosporon cavernicola]|uniref:Very-long-chain (3R)-3-hydroxyacyl-CoA dehydratase n=1 Tax=Cutaneotrichosporon cavernicola TaxID=279322 RepID=A0AA48II26_9TREE|nr:uncharacterized protein CcaverHIS019_0109060 [Cutaneotrichosporon cavernicola]BEI80385.1 hypothetical protein CcaverHIS002_0109140 [Cutaneotrichosporon cavernicola]BEI88188.1 hypothetical protein CcaverHIS019_0109060 [Cutaneotrichosporon cavernicola]BEI95960.1 hypothetical protein CcaverHIS631_0109090 [Cutaneotrichosporon cavernicola]BEJ03733.1 hypothetical protein CcaverHIS641_0109080 [Cutaneotrichosporon cavernicola]
MATTKPRKARAQSPLLKSYLLAFNALSALLWARLLFLTLWFIATPRTTSAHRIIFGQTATGQQPWASVAALADHLSGGYDFHGLGEATKWTQTLAVLEVVHAALGWVRSPVGTVASQVASRLWAVWGVVEPVPSARTNPLFATMLFAWSVTEVIRYTFYFLALLNIDLYALNWCRYTFFLVLYPLGAGSEAFLSFSTLPPLRTLPYVPKVLGAMHNMLHSMPAHFSRALMKTNPGRSLLWSVARARAAKSAGAVWAPIQIARLVLFVIWWPGLYVLYTYMLKQRRKFFAKGKTVGGVNKAN